MNEKNYYKDLDTKPIVPPIGATVTFSEYSLWHGLTGTVLENDPSLMVSVVDPDNDGNYTIVEIIWRNHINIIKTP